jgi:hypothetical protein
MGAWEDYIDKQRLLKQENKELLEKIKIILSENEQMKRKIIRLENDL